MFVLTFETCFVLACRNFFLPSLYYFIKHILVGGYYLGCKDIRLLRNNFIDCLFEFHLSVDFIQQVSQFVTHNSIIFYSNIVKSPQCYANNMNAKKKSLSYLVLLYSILTTIDARNIYTNECLPLPFSPRTIFA